MFELFGEIVGVIRIELSSYECNLINVMVVAIDNEVS
jgi:hypothetical protein